MKKNKVFAKHNSINKSYKLYQKLSDSQKVEINIGREQIKNYQSYSNEEVNSEIDKWLYEK
jgi:hypothetical protein